MTIRKMVDAAYASNIPGNLDFDCVVVYLHSPNAFHPWSASDVGLFPTKPKLPLWVYPGTGDPVADVQASINESLPHGLKRGDTIGLNVEAVNAPGSTAYGLAFRAELLARGYNYMGYTSSGTVQYVPGPLWVAAPGDPVPFPGAVARQYLYVGPYDMSIIDTTIQLIGDNPVMKPATACVGCWLHPDGTGYYLLGDDGGVFAYGLPFFGSMGGKQLAAPVVDMDVAIDANGEVTGYLLVGKDYGVFAFGAVEYEGTPA
jgi:hypothetical protein